MVMLYFMATQTLHTSRYLFLEKARPVAKCLVFLGPDATPLRNNIKNDPVRVGGWENDVLVILRDANHN